RILFGAQMNIQAPPNLQSGSLERLIAAGINDWGGVSPVTPDHVNPERPWPEIDALARATAVAGKVLVERLAIYPEFVPRQEQWLAPALHARVLRMSDPEGFARTDPWTPGSAAAPPCLTPIGPAPAPLSAILDRALKGMELSESQLVQLFAARGEGLREVCAAADALRAETCGERGSNGVTRRSNIIKI